MPSLLRRLANTRRRLTNLPWWLPLVLGAVLTLDACSRPDAGRFRTTAGEWVGFLGGERRSTAHPRPFDYLVRFDETGAAVVTPFWADHIDQLEAEAAGAVRLTIFSPWTTYSGFWALTTRTREVSVLNDPGWSQSERRVIGQAIDDVLAAEGFPEGDRPRLAARSYRDGTTVITEPLPGGYIHNALAVTLALAFLWSWTLGRPWRDWAAMRRAHHLWHGRCPRCRYPTRGYDGTICPECGHDHADPPQSGAA